MLFRSRYRVNFEPLLSETSFEFMVHLDRTFGKKRIATTHSILCLDKLADSMDPISSHVGGKPSGGSNHLVPNYQHPKVRTIMVRLHDYVIDFHLFEEPKTVLHLSPGS